MNFQAERLRPDHSRLGPQGPQLSATAARALQAFRMIEEIELGPARTRRAFQQDRIAALIAHLRTHSEFWRQRIPADRAALSRLPLLRRGELRRQVEAEGALPVPPDHGEVAVNATSGTTGEPLRFHISAHNGGFNDLRYAFDDLASGRDLSLHMTFLDYISLEERAADRWPWLTGELWRTGGATLLPCRNQPVEEIAARILTGPREHLYTRASALVGLIDHVVAGGRPARFSGEIITATEAVPPGLRALAQTHLGARVVDRYSCEEVGPIAFQCPRNETHYHVASSNVLVEAVDDDGRETPAGKPGNIVITGLNAIATPMLRYALGDIGTLLPRCPCGHDGQTLTALKGRRMMLLRLPNGKRRDYFLRTPVVMSIAPVREIRLLQTGARQLVLELSMDRPLTEEERAAYVAMLQKDLSADFAVRVDQVARIEWGSGKRVTVRNLVEEQI